MAPTAKRPNILLLVVDQLRRDWTGFANSGAPARTPNLDLLAARGMVFAQAFTPSPVCAPARACLATGLHYDANPVPNNHLDLPVDAQTYYQLLRDKAGYHVLGAGKFDLHKPTIDFGLDGSYLVEERGFTKAIDNEGKEAAPHYGYPTPHGPYMNYLTEHDMARAIFDDYVARGGRPTPVPPAPPPYESFYEDASPSALADHYYFDNWIARNAANLLTGCPAREPWQLFVSFAGPHPPWDAPASVLDGWQDVEMPEPFANSDPEAPVYAAVRRNYAAEIENLDTRIGELIQLVSDRRELNDTVIIFTSDHGEMLGDHERWGKSIYWEPSISIPLVVAGPGVDVGRSDALVSLEDIAGTILDYAGLDIPGTMTAQSLRPVLTGSTSHHRDSVVCGLADHGRNWRALVTPDYKLVFPDTDADPMLFDRETDPHELNDIANDHPEIVTSLTEDLHAKIGSEWRATFPALGTAWQEPALPASPDNQIEPQ
jgi:arylsulfatase A-like enzyme